MKKVGAQLKQGSGPEMEGRPLALPLDHIEEDPGQPRSAANPGFTAHSLAELAASIRLRGVKTPISVRHHPDRPGRYIINHGARRYRASRLAQLATIPGFIDDDYSATDQVVENLQRNELTAREIANYIGRELSKGLKRGQIASNISKSPAFVTQHAALLDLPEPVALAFNQGRVRDVTTVNELVTAYKAQPVAVTAWLGEGEPEITRGAVKLLRAFLGEKFGQEEPVVEEGRAGPAQQDAATVDAAPSDTGHRRWRCGGVVVLHQQREGILLLGRRPSGEGRAWIRHVDGVEVEIALAEVQPLRLLGAGE
ncbi:ParB/RepB/Spo0J family partition protein [Janthinobacterium sp. PSPC3-1]|uniref:ParB/RepB/Spo0J family partition protein n=1 Tax=Janthinobacterium sp. PSPC3-1 TaxID=2804653 RepID=UPI003CF83A0A